MNNFCTLGNQFHHSEFWHSKFSSRTYNRAFSFLYWYNSGTKKCQHAYKHINLHSIWTEIKSIEDHIVDNTQIQALQINHPELNRSNMNYRNYHDLSYIKISHDILYLSCPYPTLWLASCMWFVSLCHGIFAQSETIWNPYIRLERNIFEHCKILKPTKQKK